MNGTVDSRVVEMHFDNSDFMDKIEDTIGALEKLNVEIDKLNSSKGLSDSLDPKNMSNLGAALDSVKYRLSTIGVIGASVTNRLTNEAMNAAARVGGSITAVFNQIKQGGFQRAQNIEQANFLLEGLGANVKKVMEDVNYAVEGTAYGLDEAAKASAVFFAAGVKDGDKMKTALRAISGVAAMSGQSYSDMANVFQDTASKGAFMTQELRRIQVQGIAADQYLKKFFDHINEGKKDVEDIPDSVKKAVKSITNGTKTSSEDLEDLLKDGKISFEVFAQAMDWAFGEHATKANETFSGSLANVKTALSRLGEMFITPGMKAMIPLLNRMRESISAFATGLKHTAVVDWTHDITAACKVLATMINRMNQVGIVSNMAHIATASYRILAKVFKSAGKAFTEVFPEANVKNFSEILKKISDSISLFSRTPSKMEGVHDAFYIFFKILKVGYNIVSGVAKGLYKVANVLISLVSPSKKATDAMKSLMDFLDSKTKINVFWDFLAKGVETAAGLIKKGATYILGTFKELFSGFTEWAGDIHSFNDALITMSTFFAGQAFLRKGMFPFQEMKKSVAILENLFDPSTRGGILGHFAEFAKLPDRVSKTFGNLIDVLKAMQVEIDAKILKHIAVALLALAVAIKILSEIDPHGLDNALRAVTTMMAEMALMLVILKDLATSKISDSLKGLYALGSLSNALIKIGISLLLIAAAIKVLSSIDIKDLAAGTGAILVLFGAIFGFLMGLDKLFSRRSKIPSQIGAMSTAMIAIGVALNIMVRAVKSLSELNIEQLGKGLGSIVILMGSILGFLVGISKYGEMSGAGMVSAGAGMVLIAAAINVLVPAIQKFGGMKLNDLAQGITAVGASLLILATASQFMDIAGAAGILIASVAMMSLATALKTIGSLDIEQIKNALIGIAGAMALFMAVGTIVAIFPQVAIGLALVSAAILGFGAAVALAGAGLVMMGIGLASISAAIMSFASMSQTAVMMFTGSINLMLKSLMSLLPSAAVYLAEALVSFLEEIVNLAPRAKEAISSLITIALEAFMENVPRIIQTGIQFIEWLLQGIAEEIPKISAAGVAIIAGFVQGIADQMAALIEAGINLMLAFINGLAEGIRKHKGDIKSAVINLCEAILEAFCSFFGIASPSKVMRKKGIDLVKGLINGIKAYAGKVPDALINGVKSALTKLKSYAKQFLTSGATLVKNLISGIKSGISQIATLFSTAIHNAVGKVKSFASSFTTAGKNLVLGVAQGIRNGLSNVISAVGSIASQALSKFKSKLGINSPSKEFAKLGIGIPEGVVKGIGNGSSMIKAATEKLADSSLSTMQDAIKAATEEIQNRSDFNPVISPVLDLSDIYNKQSELDSMFGDRTVDLAYTTMDATRFAEAYSLNSSMNKLVDKFNRISKDLGNNSTTITNNITVDGAENPEHFANRFVRQLQLEMRTG